MIDGQENNGLKYKGKKLIDSSSNVVQGAAGEEILRFLKSQSQAIFDYPEPDSESLKSKIVHSNTFIFGV